MKCPKCGYEQDENNTECPRCGIVFKKYKKIVDWNKNPANANLNITIVEESNFISEYLLYVPERINPLSFYARIFLLVIVAIYGIYLMLGSIDSTRAGETFIHLVNLPFHEFGHILFAPFGDLIQSLGGTIGQLMIPLICFLVFIFKTRDTFAASIALWWFGENFIDIAPYINDARKLELPLLGGNTGQDSPYGFHDWEFILTELNLLQYDRLFAKISHFTGSIIMVMSLIWGAYILKKQSTNLDKL